MIRPEQNEKIPTLFNKKIEYKARDGRFECYNTETKEKTNITFDKLIILDNRISVTGFLKNTSTPIISNFVKKTNETVLEVRSLTKSNDKTVSNILIKGFYSNIKEEIKKLAGIYTNNFLALLDLGNGLEIVNFQMTGNAMYILNEFFKNNSDTHTYYLQFSKGSLVKKDGNNKIIPVTKQEEKDLDEKLKINPRMTQPIWFYQLNVKKLDKLSDKEQEIADENYMKVQSHYDILDNLLSNNKQEKAPVQNQFTIEDADDLPF